MTAPPPGAVVCQAVLDVRRIPDHRGELVNQLLLGETVRRIGKGAGKGAARGWVAVAGGEDGYRGWVRDWGLLPLTSTGLARWRRTARWRIVAPLATVTERAGGGRTLGPLPWMSRVVSAGRRGTWHRIALPDGTRGWVPASAVGPAGRPPGPLLERVRDLVGAPYLWGGRTPLGLDCSGLVQLLEAEQGVALPRDAHEQWRAGRRLAAGEALEPGDLVFFSSRPRGRMEHVGILLGRGLYAHARGTVRINGLDPSKPPFDRQLAAQVRGFTRPTKGARRRTGGTA